MCLSVSVKKSKSYGDILVVTTTSDKYISKGPGKPFFSSKIRKNLLSGLSAIDYISEIDAETAIPAIKSLKLIIHEGFFRLLEESRSETLTTLASESLKIDKSVSSYDIFWFYDN